MEIDSIYRAYDIRGIYGPDQELNENEAFKIGYYFVKHYQLNAIKIGHDARLSQKQLTDSLLNGIVVANNTIVIDYIGFVSTPQFYYSLFSLYSSPPSG